MENSSVLRENRPRSKMQASPLMFESDDDSPAVDDSANSSNKENAEESVESVSEPTKEEKILKGFQTVLMGIPPPPAFTVPQLDCREILKLWRENQSYSVTLSPGKNENRTKLCDKLQNEAKTTKWPDTLQLDYWDVYYNKSSASEELERLSVRYKERYVGSETSSCINALFAKSPQRTASARKRARHRAWGHSPGRRLSHLARRRKAFSSASLCSVAGNSNPDKKMIMVEIKKIGGRQKKKGSVKKTKPTPKKKNEALASTFKRALFQSPDQDPMNAASKTPNTQCVQRSKRNLFCESSEKKNEFGKRERPMPKRVSPRKRVNRSLSFQESCQPTDAPQPAPAPVPAPTTIQPVQALTGAHKQKMLWAATNALREEGMGMSHELFRPCMTVLFRTCQRLWVTRFAALDTEGSTSERMLALAKQFSSYTIREISSDPTSEHMALVYNNSLKMAESMFPQPSSSIGGLSSALDGNGKTSNTGKSGGSKSKKKESDKNTSVSDSPATGAKIENKAASPNERKHHGISVLGQSSKVELKNTQINPIKNTPSKVDFRDSPRSSPRLASRYENSKVQSLVCSALNSTEVHGEIPGKCDKQTNTSLKENKNDNSALSHSENLSPLVKEGNLLVRITPLKSCISSTSIETKIQNKLTSPNGRKNSGISVLGQSSEAELNNTQINSMKNTPSRVDFQDSPRSSPRLARRYENSKIKSSVCSALNFTEVHDEISGQNNKQIDTSLKENNNDNSALSHSENLNPLGKEGNPSVRITPLKSCISNREFPMSCVRRRLSELNGSVVESLRSSPRNHSNIKTLSNFSNRVDIVQPESSQDTVEKDKGKCNDMSVENDRISLEKNYNSESKLTPVKKVSFNTTSLSGSCPQGQSCDVKTEVQFNSTDRNCNESSLPCSTTSILKKTAPDMNCQNIESFVGRRVTRSISTDTKVKDHKPIHFLFSPPTTQQNKSLHTKQLKEDESKRHSLNSRTDGSETPLTTPKVTESANSSSKECPSTRTSSDKMKNQQDPKSSIKFRESDNNIIMKESDLVEKKNVNSEHSSIQKHLRSTKPPKKTASRRISWDAKSTDSVSSAVSTTSSQNNAVSNDDALTSSPEFISPRTRSRKSQLKKRERIVASDTSSSKTTPDKAASSPIEFISPEVQMRRATLRKRTSVVSSDASPPKDTPVKTVFPEEYPADTESSNGTVICGSEKSLSQKSQSSADENGEINLKNMGKGSASECISQNVKNIQNPNLGESSVEPNQKLNQVKSKFDLYLSSLDNTPTNQVVSEEPVSRMLQLYRLSTSGGDNEETEKLLPDTVCLEPPRLEPHWASDEYESEDTLCPQKSPPSLTPHWEQESCSGTSTSLPESIMEHWQQLSAKAKENSSDKIMFDFEDTSYEVTFPSANEDSRASSICAPFDFPHLVDDSKSGFNNIFRRSSTECSE